METQIETQWVSAKEAAIQSGIGLRRMYDLLKEKRIWGARRLEERERSPWLIPLPVRRIRADRGPKRRPGIPRHQLPPQP